jgi:hypothetical protein
MNHIRQRIRMLDQFSRAAVGHGWLASFQFT